MHGILEPPGQCSLWSLTSLLRLYRTRQMCLMWVIPMRDLLPLLKRHPDLYHKACSQVVPKVLMDYLTINPLEVRSHPPSACCLQH